MECEKKQEMQSIQNPSNQAVLRAFCKTQVYPTFILKINEVRSIGERTTGGTGGVIQKDKDLITLLSVITLLNLTSLPCCPSHPATKALLTLSE